MKDRLKVLSFFVFSESLSSHDNYGFLCIAYDVVLGNLIERGEVWWKL